MFASPNKVDACSSSAIESVAGSGLLRTLQAGGEGVDEIVEITFENLREAVDGVADPVIGDPILVEVVSTDSLRSVGGSHLRTTLGGQLSRLLLLFCLQQAGAQDAHRLLAVLQLGLLVLASDFDSGR